MGSSQIRVLLVEDNPGDARLLRECLNDKFVITHSLQLSDAIKCILAAPPDIVLLDLGLPDSQGISTLKQMRQAASEVPIVVLTGRDDQETAEQSLREGAQDYLVKGRTANGATAQSLRYAMQRHQLQGETDRLRLKELAMKDEFFSHISHELRSPLNAIYQFVSILNDGLAGECSPQQREYLQIVTRNVAQLQSMIGELLEVTRAGAGKLCIERQKTVLTKSIEDAINAVQGNAASKEIVLSIDVAPDLPPAYADPDRVRQVLVNLLDNAIKFTPPKGKVALKVDVAPGKPAMILFSVSDTASGINPDLCERIFERLYQVVRTDGARNGLGLGLFICRELVSRQDGHIWVKSSSREGSTFCFTIPVLSLANILEPAFSHATFQERTLSLIGLEIKTPRGWSSHDSREVTVREVRKVLSRCVLPDLDVLLPKLSPAGESEFFFVAAAVGKKGAEVVVKRLGSQLERNEHLQQERVEWSINARELSVPVAAQNGSNDELLKQTAAVVQKEIEQWTQV